MLASTDREQWSENGLYIPSDSHDIAVLFIRPPIFSTRGPPKCCPKWRKFSTPAQIPLLYPANVSDAVSGQKKLLRPHEKNLPAPLPSSTISYLFIFESNTILFQPISASFQFLQNVF